MVKYVVKYAMIRNRKVEHKIVLETDDIVEFIYKVIDEARDYSIGEAVKQREDGTVEVIFSI